MAQTWVSVGLVLSSAPQVLGDPVIDDQRPSHGPKFLTLVCLVTSAKADDPLEHFQAPQLVHDYAGWVATATMGIPVKQSSTHMSMEPN